MIDRSQLVLPLRRRTLLTAIAVSGAAWIVCPVVALLILLAACLTYTVIELVFMIVLVIGCVAIVGGLVAVVGGLFTGSDGAGFLIGGLGVAAVGGGLFQLAPHLNVGEAVFAAMLTPARNILTWFVAHDWCVWAWIPAALAVAIAGATGMTILAACYLPQVSRRIRRTFHDCPECHHRGRPVHICPRCGAEEPALRSSGYGVFFARCSQCRQWLPTLDLLGRSTLRRRCGGCSSLWANPHIGRLCVWHVAVIHAEENFAPRTTMVEDRKRLIFFHESGMEHVANSRSASELSYLRLLDQVVFVGEESSLTQTAISLAGILGVIERGIAADVRHRHDLRCWIVKRHADRLKLLTAKEEGPVIAKWRTTLTSCFTEVSTWLGNVELRSLASLV